MGKSSDPKDDSNYAFFTGIPKLDQLIEEIRPGDNIVFQVDNIEDYIPFVRSFVKRANEEKQDLIYFRFAQHDRVVPSEINADVIEINPELGFEPFITKILDVITEYGYGGCYVFDCLSDLAVDWYSDVMLANFFKLTCPYLLKYKTATYFALIRGHNTIHAIQTIHSTAQVVLDVYTFEENMFIHPLKVENRTSPTMYMLHTWECDNPIDEASRKESNFKPVADSITISQILSRIEQPWLDFTTKKQDHFIETFQDAQIALNSFNHGKIPFEHILGHKEKLLRMMIARSNDNRSQLASKVFELQDLLNIGKRLIGTGLIGGKSVGMLMAQTIIKNKGKYWEDILETHDSFFIGSDNFYSYLVYNDIWWKRQKLSHPDTFLEGIDDARYRMSRGKFSSSTRRQFASILNYYGQSPIIVRSSSIQEDALGNAFSGKYESIYLSNQGSPEKRLEKFCDAVRQVYTSAISRDALIYRKDRGLLELDEQMALLVQRVSGSIHGDYYFPDAAGVGFSFNPYVWDPSIDPFAGFLRLVAGLGTRAVDRTEDDYTRLIALNKPNARPEHSQEQVNKFSQKKFDLIDLKNDRKTTIPFYDLIHSIPFNIINLLSSSDFFLEEKIEAMGKDRNLARYIDFEGLIRKTPITEDFRKILAYLEEIYEYPVDIEYTINFQTPTSYKINLLQCRTFQVRKEKRNIEMPETVDEKKYILKTTGPIIGTSIAAQIGRLIYIVPKEYGVLPMQQRYAVARLVGELTKAQDLNGKKVETIMLLGPGRWGTSSPSLGIPTSFSEISNVSIIGEIAEMHEGLIPDVSLGSHFFNDLVELDMMYLALHPSRSDNLLNRDFIENGIPNSLCNLILDAGEWESIIKVYDLSDLSQTKSIFVGLNSVSQEGICYFKDK